MAKYHLNYSLYEMAKKRINEHDFKDASIRPALHTVVKLFAVKQLMDDSECLYETGFFEAGSGKLRDEAFKKLLNDKTKDKFTIIAESYKHYKVQAHEF